MAVMDSNGTALFSSRYRFASSWRRHVSVLLDASLCSAVKSPALPRLSMESVIADGSRQYSVDSEKPCSRELAVRSLRLRRMIV